MQAVVVFLVSAIAMTAVAVAAAFAAWKVLPDPGTAGALFVLFILCPAVGVASGIFAARWWGRAPSRAAAGGGGGLVAPAVTAVLALAAGFSLAHAWIDISNQRFAADGGPGPAWTNWAPLAAGVAFAAISAVAVRLRSGGRR